MTDIFESLGSGLDSPATNHYTVTPSDSTDLPFRPRGIRILTDGNIAIRDVGGVDITYPVTAGEVMPFRVIRVLATGTTATAAAWY